jgi:hypothetical protein
LLFSKSDFLRLLRIDSGVHTRIKRLRLLLQQSKEIIPTFKLTIQIPEEKDFKPTAAFWGEADFCSEKVNLEKTELETNYGLPIKIDNRSHNRSNTKCFFYFINMKLQIKRCSC